jgi:hypothetical protein
MDGHEILRKKNYKTFIFSQLMGYKTLYKLLISAFVLFTACKDNNTERKQRSKTPQKQITNDTLIYVVIGKPFRPKISQIIANNYGFKFNYLGCIRTAEKSKLEKEKNAKTEKSLKAKFGDNFWDIFDKDVDSLGKIEDKLDSITNLVARLEVVEHKRIQVENSSNFKRRLSFVTTPKDTIKNTYLVKVSESFGENEKVYFNYLVNASTMKIISSSKQ